MFAPDINKAMCGNMIAVLRFLCRSCGKSLATGGQFSNIGINRDSAQSEAVSSVWPTSIIGPGCWAMIQGITNSNNVVFPPPVGARTTICFIRSLHTARKTSFNHGALSGENR
jgi:hypothetical protein